MKIENLMVISDDEAREFITKVATKVNIDISVEHKVLIVNISSGDMLLLPYGSEVARFMTDEWRRVC